MNKVFIVVVVVLVTISCDLGAILNETAVPPELQIINTDTPVPKTDVPTQEPTVPRAKKFQTTLIPSFTPKPPATPTPNPYAQFQKNVNAYGNPKLDDVLVEFSNSTFNKLDDFSEMGATLKSIFWWDLAGYNPNDFLVSSHVNWEHQTSSISNSAAGCGYIFYNNHMDQVYFAVLSLDGNVRIIYLLNGYWDGMAHKKTTQTLDTPNGEADLILAVINDRLTFAVNGEIVIDQPFDFKSNGSFGYSILSGRNNPDGTRCTFTDTILLIND